MVVVYYFKILLVATCILAVIFSEIRCCLSRRRYQLLAMILSVTLGFILGKVYERVGLKRSLETKMISSLVMNGIYEMYFKEVSRISDTLFKVEHILENKFYTIWKKTYLIEDEASLLKTVADELSSSGYVTSWVEGMDGLYELYI